MMVEHQKCTVEQRLKEMKERLSKLSSSQRMSFNEDTTAHSKIQAQEYSQSPSKHKPDSSESEGIRQPTNKKQRSKHMENDDEKGMTA